MGTHGSDRLQGGRFMRTWFSPKGDVPAIGVSENRGGRTMWAPVPRLCGITDIGSSRSDNQDRFFIASDLSTWIVADGMGGLAVGDLAAELTITAIAGDLEASSGRVSERLLGAVNAAQSRVLAYSHEVGVTGGMGAAVVVALLDGNTLHVAHVGDARAYVLANEVLTPLTQDHSVAAAMVRAGIMSSDQARRHPDKALLQQAVGLARGILPALATYELSCGDRVLLCSDGLWEALSDAELAEVLRSDGSMRQLASVLVQRAIEASGGDNVTVVTYEHQEEFIGRSAGRIV